MKRYFFLAMAAVMTLAFTITSCSDVELENAPYSEPVTNLQYTLSKKNVTITWTAPSGASEVAVYLDNTQKATLPISTTSYTFENIADGEEHVLTVKAIYQSAGRISEGTSLTVQLESKTKAAFLLPTGVSAYTNLPDDDEQAAGAYFQANFVANDKGQFVHVNDIAGLDLEEVPVIWIMVDRVGIGLGVENLPYTSAELEVIKAFVKKGGNLYLSNFATQIAYGIGRIGFNVTCFGDGEGGTHNDIWTANTVLGCGMGTPYNRTDHAMFTGITQENYNSYGHNTIALLGPGTQEDHNCFWIPADCGQGYGGNGDVQTVPNFENANTAKILAAWGQVTDYCVGGIIEFEPTDTYKGIVLINGLAAYEWNQQTPAGGQAKNVYQNNIEKLTTNALNYLK